MSINPHENLFGERNKMDLSIGIAIGSSTQVAVFIAPIAVLLGWLLNVNMSLQFC